MSDNEDPEQRVRTDFDCPTCSANNPHDDGFKVGDEVRCHYCGQEFKVALNSSGKIKLREI